MNTTTDSLVLEHLRAIRADTTDIKSEIRDIKARIASIESYIATLHGDQIRTSIKMDELAQRVERLEKRVGLLDA